MNERQFLYYLILTALLPGTLSATGVSAISGKHLRLLAMEFPVSFTMQRNATGHLVYADGMEKHMIQSLSQMLNFSYSFLPIITTFADDTPSARGAISYLFNDEADYYLSSTLANPFRFQRADFPAYWIYFPFSTLLPYPKETFNLKASLKPLSYEVWILIAIATFTIITYLKIALRKNYIHQSNIERDDEASKENKGAIGSESVIPYVIGNLVSQGQRHFPKRLAIRIAAGAWCCTCFFLVQTYSCTLTSHLMSPNQKNLVDSFFEIADAPSVSLTVDKGYAIDKMMQITESVNVKRFVDTLKNDNRLITCNITAHCIEQVKLGKAIYSAPANSLSVIMAASLKNTGTCQYTRTKGTFWSSPVFTLLRKNSPYTEIMSRGILRLHETGLLLQWEKWYVPSSSQCMKVNERTRMPRLSIKHLSSAFVILIAGYFISLSVFVAERILGKLQTSCKKTVVLPDVN